MSGKLVMCAAGVRAVDSAYFLAVDGSDVVCGQGTRDVGQVKF